MKPFDTLDTVSEKQRISEMLTEENAELLSDYFIRRGKAAQTDGGARALGILPKEYDKVLFKKVKRCAQQFCEPSAFMMLSRRICARHLNYLNALYLV